MPTATRTVSARLPAALLEEAKDLIPEKKISEIIVQALTDWIAVMRRQHEDELIRQALSSMSDEQRQEEQKLTQTASRSSLRVMESRNG
ncbi:MAG: hypothetical protein JSV03_15520 [Planctomycetota bacterium]|nr:MAG: hypothetical protein JSV03_15520 [Planctomycetota bacterium]